MSTNRKPQLPKFISTQRINKFSELLLPCNGGWNERLGPPNQAQHSGPVHNHMTCCVRYQSMEKGHVQLDIHILGARTSALIFWHLWSQRIDTSWWNRPTPQSCRRMIFGNSRAKSMPHTERSKCLIRQKIISHLRFPTILIPHSRVAYVWHLPGVAGRPRHSRR